MTNPQPASPAQNDFRSDTFTTPTPRMFEAMMRATVGDAVYEEDQTTNEFESYIADLTGKDSAMFCVSGTMSNQIAIRSHLHQPPHSVLCDYRAHIYVAEAAGLAIHSQAMVIPVHPKNGVYITLEEIKNNIILGDNIHTAPTKVISLENTLGGSIMPLDEIKRISEYAREHDIKMHLDGARLWNAAATTGISLSEYCSYFDTVSLCLSKGLCAPIGSVLVGPRDLIKKAVWFKKQQGGGIRQSGMLCAAARVAVDEVWPTMKQTHEKTKRLAEDIEKLGVTAQLPVDTNFIFLDAQSCGLNVEILVEEGAKRGIKLLDERIVLHYHTSDDSIEALKDAVHAALIASKGVPSRPNSASKVYRSHNMNGKN